MCGLVGMAGNIVLKDEKAFKTLLILDSLRGEHSTGIAAISPDAEAKIAKSVGDPFQLLESRAFDKAMNGKNIVLIGHNRFATTGKINRNNAHPFEFSHIVGAHNGTLRNKHVLPNAIDHDVDSQALYASIMKQGVKESIDKLDGAWALTWWNKQERTINFLRNKERPLVCAFNEAQDVIYWASEAWMLDVATSREDIKLGKKVVLREDLHIKIGVSATGVMGNLFEEEVKSSYVPFQGVTYIQGGKGASSGSKSHYAGSPVGVEATTLQMASMKQDVLNVAGTKGMRLNVRGMTSDANGGKYLICSATDWKNSKDVVIRLYYNKKADESMIGKEVFADIESRPYVTAHNYSYCRAVYSTVRYANAVTYLEEEKEEPEIKTVPGPKGEPFSIAAWKAKFHSCAWCGGNVEHTSDFEYAGVEDVVCEDCKHIPDVKEYLRTVKTY